MMKRIRVSTEGLSRLQTELRQMRGVIDMHHRQCHMHTFQHQQAPPATSDYSSQPTSTTTVKYRAHHNPETVPQNTPRKRIKSDMQNLADIILQQAHRIEKQQQELHSLKLHYERQVSAIKNNAKMLEQQLEKLQGNVNKTKAMTMGNHYKEIFSAVEKLQK
ncbi:hypothetical protein KR059_008865, partial [Drosophila kikkawai]